MPTFAYKAKSAAGAVTEGVLEAAEQKVAVDRLRAQKLTILEINEAGGGLGEMFGKLNPFKPKVKSYDLVLFSRQLSTLVSAGVPIVQGLTILENQMENPAFKSVLGRVRTDIESGLSISDALHKHPKAFPELYTSMVKAGELGGILDTILERLSSYLEGSEALKSKVKGAMVYPVVVLFVAGCITIFLLSFVVPRIGAIFESFDAELPFITQMLLGASKFVKSNLLYIAVSPIAGFYGFKKLYATSAGQRKVDEIMLKLPVFGILLKKMAVSKFTRTLGTLIKSGVPIMQGLETVAATAGNVIVAKAVFDARDSVREGGRLADPLKKSGIFPPMVTQMISVGEETGSLDIMLTKIADFYDGEVDSAVKALTSMIEPMVMVVMGVVIGFIVIAMFLPMMSLGDIASKAG